MNTPSPRRTSVSPGLKLVLDMGPLAVFFVTYKFANLMIATGSLMVATIVALSITYVLTKRLAIMPLVMGVTVMVFGGLTLWLNSEVFIKLKLTIIYALMAGSMYVGLYMGRPLAKLVLEGAVEMPDWCWRVLTHRVAAMFVVVALSNEVARRLLTTDDWVNFKVFGVTIGMFIFFMANAPFIMRNQIEHDEASSEKAAEK
jgi:intracellular septation protein